MDLIVDILENIFGEIRKYNSDTSQIAFDCPACSLDKNLPHGDGKGNLEINFRRNKYRCWSCQDVNYMHGSVLWLLKKYANAKQLRTYKSLIPELEFLDEKVYKEIDLKLPTGYLEISKCTGFELKFGEVMYYLKKRGITDEMIKKFKIGYTITDRFFNRIIIPSYDNDNKLNYFIARWFSKEYTKIKYLNPDVEKQNIIFNVGLINWDATIYLVEGATDHIVVPNSIPLLGKFLSNTLLYELYEKANAYIVILLDDDAYDDAITLYKQLDFGKLRGRIRICKPPTNHDPSSINTILGNKGITKLLRSAIKLDDTMLG